MKIKAISISDRKGIRKKNIESAVLVEDFGLENDAHAGKWHRQVSLLAQESIDTMREKGLDVVAGNFAENITTEGINLEQLKVGEHIQIGKTHLIISQLGKVCHHKCAIYHQAGDCVMPREGIFGIVYKGGKIKVGDPIIKLQTLSASAAIVATKAVEKQHGEELYSTLKKRFSPAFIRFDNLNTEENNLQEILTDLAKLQQVNDILVFDPSGKHALAFIGYDKLAGTHDSYRINSSNLHYCKDVGSLNNF